MILEINYYPDDLEYGECRCCGEESAEIVKGDGRCVGCIEEERFIGMTMTQGYNPYGLSRLDSDDW